MFSNPDQESFVQEEQPQQYLVFSVDESYALELSKIVEILEYKPITRVPETPPYIAGMMNRHGSVLPVIDMRKRFHKEDRPDLPYRCIIVIRFDEMKLGLVVDNVNDLITLDPGSISAPPQVGPDYAHVFIKGIGVHEQKMMLIVDADRLVNQSDLTFLEEE